MYHMYPMAKGDALCPLGFHPQVRWPTRCKRCFRDYKEHGGKRRDEDHLRKDGSTASTPSLSLSSKESEKKRNWMSSTNLAGERERKSTSSSDSDSDYSNPSSWISTPDLANLQDDTQAVTTVSIKLPKRKQKAVDTGQRTVSDSFSLPRPDKSSIFSKEDDLATRAKKLREMKETTPKPKTRGKSIQIKEVKTISEEPTNHDVQFLIKVKRKPIQKQATPPEEIRQDFDDDAVSTTTETTDTTLVDIHDNELREELESLKRELEVTKSKCDRLEREKSDMLLRRLAAMETTTSKTTATEVLKLQQKCNELQQQLEDYKDEKKSLSLKVKELEEDLELRPTAQQAQKTADELRQKLLAAETLCEELMDENEDMKKELRDMIEQMEEMQDNFREDQAVEYTSIKKELDQTTKNCRILSFKLKKAERRAEQLEYEKQEIEKKFKEVSGGASTLSQLETIKRLEQELKISNEVSLRLQKQLEEANSKEPEEKTLLTKKKPPSLASIGKTPSGDGKVSRESLTRGGSQDDPAQLLRDLQDSLEREADLREQLKYAEEEAQTLRKKVTRIEDDNELLAMQLKKMATRARTRKLSPTNQRLTPESPTEGNDISEDDDPSEIKLHLELSEQEVSSLRKKVEELEAENDRLKNKTKELQDKVAAKTTTKKTAVSNDKGNSLQNQKLKILEDETNDLRKKLIEKERDCERLHAELSLNQKRSKGIQKSKSLDLDQQTLDLKRQLQVIEQEASVLRNKVQTLESENDKLSSENKRLSLLRGTKKSDKTLDKYINKIAALELELESSKARIKELEDSLAKSADMPQIDLKGGELFKKFSQRTPKKFSTVTTREQLKTMVSDLEKEIGEMLVAIKTSENTKIKLEEEMSRIKDNSEIQKAIKDLQELNEKYEKAQKQLEEEKLRHLKEQEELNKTLSTTKEKLTKSNEEKKKYKEQIEKLNKEQQKFNDDKKILDDEINKLKADLKLATSKQDEFQKKSESLTSNLESKEKELLKLKDQLKDKSNLESEVSTKDQKLKDLELKVTDLEDKCKKYDKQVKDQTKDYQVKIDNEIEKYKLLLSDKSKVEDEKKKLNSKLDTLNTKIKKLENTIEEKNELVKSLEDKLLKEQENLSKSQKEELDKSEINRLKDEISKLKSRSSELESQLETAKKSQKVAEDKLKKFESNINSNLELEKKNVELEINLKNEKKKNEIMKSSHEKEQKNRELELNTLKAKIKRLESIGANPKKEQEIKQLHENIEKLEADLESEKLKYDDLTVKYEILEEEHVVTKAKLVTEKESLENQLKARKKEIEQLEKEVKTLQETYNSKQEIWKKEKNELQGKLKLNGNNNGQYNGSTDYERSKLKLALEQKQSEFDQIKKEYDAIHDQMEFMRRENDDLKKKLDDYEKVNKVQRNISADSSAMEKEIKQLRQKISNLEKSKNSDLAECKMRYNTQLKSMNDELQSLQSQVMRFKREKDAYKHMLESAQKTIGDLKQSPKSHKESGHTGMYSDELEDAKNKVAMLEEQISCMEDEMSDTRLECSRLKTELVSERSTWEVKLSELQSRVNELEEEKVLSSGRTKIVGLRTKMELAWQKEREEQQRLLQETATLARDLRQTLFEVERERDKERLESKRKQDQLKKTFEEEQEENKRKMSELQCDLLELRDAHAKLRTTNEKLRREKERYEKEREELRFYVNGKRRTDQEDDRKITTLIDQIDNLKQLAPELFFSQDQSGAYTPTPPRRTRSKSRETSPAIDIGKREMTPGEKQQHIQYIMQRLVNTTEDLRKIQKSAEDEYDRERIKRRMGMRRATSTEQDNIPDAASRYSRPYRQMTPTLTNTSLHRKSLSLEHTIHNEQEIWKNESDSMSSWQSLELASDVEGVGRRRRDASLDSRLSGGSTQSDMGEKKKKKGIFGKLKKLTKSRSIDDQDPGTYPSPRPLSSRPNSNSDLDEAKGSKKDLKEKITGIFKKAGSSSRSNSVERQEKLSSTHRPLMRHES